MRSHLTLRSVTLSSALALVACSPVSLGRDTGGGVGAGTGGGSATSSTGSGGSTASSGVGAGGGGGGSVFAPSMTPTYLVIDDANVYWADAGAGIRGMAKSGGKAWKVVTVPPVGGAGSVFDLEVDSTGVYYTASDVAPGTSSVIRKAPLLGGATTLIAQSATVACFTLAGTDLYYVDQFASNTPGGAIYRTATSGGAPVTVVAEPASTGGNPGHEKVTPLGLVTDGASLYWLNIGPDGADASTWGVAGATLLGGAPMRIGNVTPHQSGNCKHIAVDDTFVYWLRELPSPAVVRASKQGGPETVLAADDARHLVIDASHVYYTTGGSTGGSVRRVAKTGGTPEILVNDQKHPFAIAVDAHSVYWTDMGTLNGGQFAGDGAVMQIAKP